MKTIHLAGALLCVAMLAGCGDRQPAAPAAAAASADGTAASAAAPCPASTASAGAYSPLPAYIHFDRPFLVVNDRMYVTKAGAERRRAVLQLKDGDPVQVAQDFVQQLESQGYKQLPPDPKAPQDGVTRFALTKAGAGRVNVNANPKPGHNPSYPDSPGVVAVDWPSEAPGTAPTVATTAPAAAE